jgi:hypothetical protein
VEALERTVDSLCRFVEEKWARTIVIARSGSDDPVELRAPPLGFAVTTEDIATKIVSVLAQSLADETDAVGVVFPAVKREARIEASEFERADGWAVCAAGRTTSGARSVGIYWPLGGACWEEAYSGLDWLWERLSLRVIEGPIPNTARPASPEPGSPTRETKRSYQRPRPTTA